MTAKQSRVFRDGSKLVHVTGESPRQFNGLIFVVHEGETPESVGESLRSVDQLKGLQEVDVSTLSVSWKNALKLPKGSPSKSEPSHPVSRVIVVKPDEAPSPKYIKVSPALGWFALNAYIGMGVLTTLAIGKINLWFLGMILILSVVAVLYAVAATIATKEVAD